MKRKSFTNFLIIFAILISIYLADSLLKFHLAAKIGYVLRPVATVVADIGGSISGFFTNFGKIGSLQNENKDLREKVNKLLAENAKLAEDEKENLALKRDLGFKESQNFDLVAAEVVSFDPSNIRNTITINVGTANNLKNGDIVISEGFLVGTVINIEKNTAKIRLVNDSDSAIPANISGNTISGIVKGSIGGGLTLDQVPQSEKVNMGDIVVTSGLGGDFPKGLIIGKVEEIQKISGSIFQLVNLRPMVEITKLERVMVIKR